MFKRYSQTVESYRPVEVEIKDSTTCQGCGHLFEFWKKKSWGRWKPKFCPSCVRIDREEGGSRSIIIR